MKRRIRKTGEIIDVIADHELFPGQRHSSDTVSYIDSKGKEHPEEPMNLEWDTEEIEESGNMDKKFELLKVIMPYFCALFNKIHNLKDYSCGERNLLHWNDFKNDFFNLIRLLNCEELFDNINSISDDDSNINKSEDKESNEDTEDEADEAESQKLSKVFHEMAKRKYFMK